MLEANKVHPKIVAARTERTLPAEESAEPVTIESLQSLLRAARQYVFDAEVPYEHLYDDQQNLLARIDAAAPPPAPPKPTEPCDKDPHCIYDKGHAGDCDDTPF